MSDPIQDASGLAEKIVEAILKDPANAEQHKALLAATFQEVSEIESDTGTKEEKVKHLFTSKTFWGVIFGLLGTFGPKLGLHLHIAGADQTALISDLTTLAGSGFAIYGRMKANSKVTLV